jgi:hypothetical protein
MPGYITEGKHKELRLVACSELKSDYIFTDWLFLLTMQNWKVRKQQQNCRSFRIYTEASQYADEIMDAYNNRESRSLPG